MSKSERLTITLPIEMAFAVKGAVETGDYASTSEVVKAALRDWTTKRAVQIQDSALKADIAVGLADVAAGRIHDFDVARIVGQGRRRSAGRLSSG